MRLAFLILFAFAKFFRICISIELDCHKEQKFVKVDQGMLCFVYKILDTNVALHYC